MAVNPNASPFAGVAAAPPDPILGLTEAFQADTNPAKVNLGVGVYQDADGKVPILQTVHEAAARWLEKEPTKSYLPIDGAPSYNQAVQRLLLGAGSQSLADGRVVTAQALGGTGALKLGADLVRRFMPGATVWLSTPSWENHRALFEGAGFPVRDYAYYDPATRGLDFEGMVASLMGANPGDVVVLHACCHNPTGVDMTAGQWRVVVDLCRDRGLLPFLDFAYQGFAEGLEPDATAVRLFAESGLPCLVASSFSKSFSIYRERVGALTLLLADAAEARRVLSQLKRVIRTNYSNPASHGAQVVALVLHDETLRARWEVELAGMRDRIRTMRARFVAALAAHGVAGDYGFIERQRGMFSYSGLPLEVVRRLRSDHSVYVVDSGRICVAALTEANVDTVAAAIARASAG